MSRVRGECVCVCVCVCERERERERERESMGASWEPIQPCEKASLSIGARERGPTDDEDDESRRVRSMLYRTKRETEEQKEGTRADRASEREPDRDSACRVTM